MPAKQKAGRAAAPRRRPRVLGFVGLGVMGGPMCANLALRSGLPVLAYDIAASARRRAARAGAQLRASVAEVAAGADILFLSLPGPAELRAVMAEVLRHARPGAAVVDMSSVPVPLSRVLAARCARRGLAFADAPVAGTRHTVGARRISVMVGAEPAVFRRIAPFLGCVAETVQHCGGVGAGGVVKLAVNAVIAQTVVALAEVLAMARRAGVDGRALFAALAQGCDSFPLRHHGLKFLLPGRFPEGVFPTRYMLKDVRNAVALAHAVKVPVRGMKVAERLLSQSAAMGLADAYWPVLIRAIEAPPANRKPRRRA